MQISLDKIIVSLLSNPVSGNDFIIETFSLKNTTTHIRILDGVYVLYQVGSSTKRKYSKGKANNLTVSLYSCGQYKQGSTGIRFDFELDFTRIQKSDVIADDVAIMLREANLSLGEPTQLDSMVMAINRLEGVEQDDTNRAIAMLVDAGRITPREGMLLAVRHAKQR
jgi:hypothetical protein